MYWFPNFLAMVSKREEISQQVVTKMEDLASEFSKVFPGVMPPDPHSGRGRPPPAPSTRAQVPGCWDPNLGPPQLFSRGCAPICIRRSRMLCRR